MISSRISVCLQWRGKSNLGNWEGPAIFLSKATFGAKIDGFWMYLPWKICSVGRISKNQNASGYMMTISMLPGTR
jgi:hypothetical protein